VGPIDREGFGRPVKIEKPSAEFDIPLPIKGTTGRDSIQLTLDYYYCREGAEGLCRVGSVAWVVPVEFSATANTNVIRLQHAVK
jgi:hypothetical protein